MIMIDVLLEATPERGLSAKTFKDEEYGVWEGRVCETALVECVAQTTAAFLGFHRPLSADRQERGLLVAVSAFFFARRPRVGEPLLIEARLDASFEKMLLIKGVVFAGGVEGERVAEGELKVYLKNGEI
jgi:hypothetical protein